MEKLWNSNYTKIWWANFMIFFSINVITPFLPIYLSETFGVNKGTTGFVLTGYTLMALISRPFSGYLVDSFPRRIVLLSCYFLFFAFFAGYLVAGSLTFFAIIRTLHGAPMGSTTVANSTVAIDVLHPTRRSEGIGYYGMSNNLATSISPFIGSCIYDQFHSFELIFAVALLCSFLGFILNSTVKFKDKEVVPNKEPISLDRFFLVKGWRLGVAMTALAFSYGVISNYLALYGIEVLGITTETGLWFLVLSFGLILSRFIGARSLRKGKALENACGGMLLSVIGYFLFAAFHNNFGYYGCAIIVGLGNGHMWPAFQTMFINYAPNNKRGTANSTQLTMWDAGMGIGIMVGGFIIEHMGYDAAFWAAWIVNVLGVIFFFACVKQHFLLNKLR